MRYPVVAMGACALLLAAGAVSAAEESPAIPLKRVVLFNSGVGFFEHSGTVEGNAKIDMRFNVRDINDLLKSMVVQDFDNGQISTVTYGSKDPISKTLKTFAVDLTANPTMGQLLAQLRGEQVEVEAPGKTLGVILGVEVRKKKVGENEFQEVEFLNLVTDAGLRSIALEQITSIRLTNKTIDEELRKALTLLASSLSTDKKTVSLSFTGEGKRRVRVGYIQETPVWKTTYRMILGEEKPVLQGWAIVENTSEQDWSNVDLRLLSGRPISFTMDLYEPLYVPRPEVELELYASLRPQTYGQDLARREKEFAALRQADAGAVAGLGERRAIARDEALQNRAMSKAAPGAPPMLAAAAKPTMDVLDGKEKADLDRSWAGPGRVRSAAATGDVGESFEYRISAPVSLPRQQSAMLPIVDEEIQAEKVSIYNPQVHAKHPLAGLRFTNSTKLHLMQGPITVFDEGAYAGDAKIEDIPPGSQRLLSYAMDLDTEVAPQSKSQPDELLSVKIVKGTLHASRKYVRSTEYTVKNSGRKAKKILIESPLDPNWKLTKPAEPAEKTRDQYRFVVEAKPGEPTKLVVEEERTDTQYLALTNIDDGTIRFYLGAPVVSEKVKMALAEVVKRKQEIAQTVFARQQAEQRIAAIEQDQARISRNMGQLDRQSDVYKSYVKKFSDQEAEIEKLRGQISEMQAREQSLRKALDEYLIGLDLS